MPLELALTVTPFLIISVLFYFTVVVQEKMLHLAKDPDSGGRRDSRSSGTGSSATSGSTSRTARRSTTARIEARKKAMTSKPEGKDAHGEERVGPVAWASTPRTGPT